MVETMNRIMGQLAAGTTTLPRALLDMWSAGREAERFDGLLMEKAQREAKRARGAARKVGP
jgi:hypothetical protein